PALRKRREPLLSFEQGRELSDFDLLAFSISFETDYLNLPAILDLAGIPLWREQRRERDFPLIIAGGSAIFLNPEPIADFVDLFLIGEGEEMIPEFIQHYRQARQEGSDRTTTLHRVARTAGAYLPELYTPRYDDVGRLAAIDYRGEGNGQVKRRLLRDLNGADTASLILTPESVFGDMYLVEASRGCQWGCRFCAAGFMYRPIRYRSPERLLNQARRGLQERRVIGLVGAEMASVPAVAQLASAVAQAGGRLSPSSLKADCISPDLAAALAQGGARSVTIAPEAGSERMRKVINKNLTQAAILQAAEMMVGEGVESLKLYFMLGLPEEHEEDVIAIATLTAQILERVRQGKRHLGKVTVSLNPFVPKPWTPFQWDPMADLRSSKRKIALLRTHLMRLGGVEMDAESPREAYFQTLLSRGDRRVGAILARLQAEGCEDAGSIWHALGRIRREAIANDRSALPNPDHYVYRAIGHNELLPWDFIDHSVSKWFLLSERKKAHFEHQTRPCDVTRCTVCGAC
ncbi:MAG TPA: radical SAM protein, partial [Candidatus Binataceae bacterium]|nr:radical SAM protein [Candidatus Binataceae bacterium]